MPRHITGHVPTSLQLSTHFYMLTKMNKNANKEKRSYYEFFCILTVFLMAR